MELTQLKHFQAIARSENITTASKQLFVSQPSLTRTVNKLEAELGVKLFDRAERRLRLNRAGRIVLAYTNMILKTEDAFLEAMRQRTNPDTIRLCTSSVDLLGQLIPKLESDFPDNTILYELGQNINFKYHLLHHKTDLGIFNLPLSHPSLVSELLFYEQISISVPLSNPLSRKEALTLSDLSGQSFVHYVQDNSASHLIQHLKQEGQILTVTLPDIFACSLLLDTDEKYLLALSSMTSGFLSTKPGRKIIPLSMDEGFDSAYYAAYRVEDAPRLRAFIDWLKNSV